MTVGFFGWLSGVVQRRAKWVVGAWLLLGVVLAIVAPPLSEVGVQDDADFLPSDSPAQEADNLLRSLFPNDPARDAAIIVIARDGGLGEHDAAWLRSWVADVQQRDGVAGVQSAALDPALAQLLRSPDGAAELTVVDLEVAPFSAKGHDLVSDLRQSLRTAPPGLQGHLTGLAGLAADQAEGIEESFARTAIVTLLLVLTILVLVYRSALAPLVPLASIGVAFLVSRGVIGLLAERGLRVASLAETFMVLIVFGAGTDYCLFLVSRYREDLSAGEPTADTVRRTSQIMGPVLAASAATVAVGFLAQLSAKFGLFRTMGPALAIAVVIALAAGLTLTPALLTLLGRHAFWPTPLEQVRSDPRSGSLRWQRVATVVRNRPAEMLLAGAVLLLLPAAGLGWYKQSFDLVRDLPDDADARTGFEVLEQHFPGGRLSPIYVVLADDEPILTDQRTDDIDRLTQAIRELPGVAEVRSITQPAGAPLTTATAAQLGGGTDAAALGIDPNTTDLTPLFNAMASPEGLRFDATTLARYPALRDRIGGFFLGTDGNSTRLLVSLDGNPYDPAAKHVFHDIDDVADRTLAGGSLTGARLAVGGPAAFYVDIQDIGAADTRTMGVVLFGGIFIVLALLLRSVVAPFYLLATVLASFAATLGLTVVIFQGLLGDPGISWFVTPLLFIILVALGADYNIFVISRIREELGAGRTPADAAEHGLVQTGRVITSAGLILAGTFAALLVAPLPNLRQMGFAVAVGILIDTFIVRSLLVPAATVLLDRWAFWPGYQRDRGQVLGRRHIGRAAGAVGAFTLALVVIAATTSRADVIDQISAQAQPAPQAAGTVNGDAASTPTAAPSFETTATTAGTAAEPTAPTPPRNSSSAASAAPATQQRQLLAPKPGRWTYRLEGTRRLGVAGSTQPFSEDAPTEVEHLNAEQRIDVRLRTQTGAGTEEDRRSYSASAVALQATQRTSAGMSFGGTLQPPHVLLHWPAETGRTWRTDWTTETLRGTSTSRVTANRTIVVAGNPINCVEVVTDSNFSGDAEGTQHETACWAPDLGMIIAADETFTGTFRNVPFEIKQRRALLTYPG